MKKLKYIKTNNEKILNGKNAKLKFNVYDTQRLPIILDADKIDLIKYILENPNSFKEKITKKKVRYYWKDILFSNAYRVVDIIYHNFYTEDQKLGDYILNLIPRISYETQDAKRYTINKTNQNIWIPNFYLQENGKIKENVILSHKIKEIEKKIKNNKE